jgi:glutamine amidotransferase
MASHVVMLPAAGSPQNRADEAVLVRDGFSWPAFLVPPLWLLWHRLWAEGIIAILVMGAFSGLGEMVTANGAWSRAAMRMKPICAMRMRLRPNPTGWNRLSPSSPQKRQGNVRYGLRLRLASFHTAETDMRVAIIDYGSGNLRSATRAFERAAREAGIAADIELTADAQRVRDADRIVLPGVGAYADCAAGLRAVDGMWEAVEEAAIDKGRPFLGICVGMQLPSDPALKIPQIGWNTLEVTRDHPVFAGIPTGPKGLHAYFVHSYHLEAQKPEQVIAVTDYGGPVTAAVARDNLVGTQFHPEKSQALGLALIANFLRWTP